MYLIYLVRHSDFEITLKKSIKLIIYFHSSNHYHGFQYFHDFSQHILKYNSYALIIYSRICIKFFVACEINVIFICKVCLKYTQIFIRFGDGGYVLHADGDKTKILTLNIKDHRSSLKNFSSYKL